MTRATIRCPHCGYALAQTDGQKLYLAGVTVHHSITLHCGQAACRGFTRWYPAPRVKDRAQAVPA